MLCKLLCSVKKTIDPSFWKWEEIFKFNTKHIYNLHYKRNNSRKSKRSWAQARSTLSQITLDWEFSQYTITVDSRSYDSMSYSGKLHHLIHWKFDHSESFCVRRDGPDLKPDHAFLTLWAAGETYYHCSLPVSIETLCIPPALFGKRMSLSNGNRKISFIILSPLVGTKNCPRFVILPVRRNIYLSKICILFPRFCRSSATVQPFETLLFELCLNFSSLMCLYRWQKKQRASIFLEIPLLFNRASKQNGILITSFSSNNSQLK